MDLKSPAFDDLDLIPVRYTGEGQDMSPPLYWKDVPTGTSSFALLCHDPDAPLVSNGGYGFVHWVMYNIPADVRGLQEGDYAFTSGLNDSGEKGYVGPFPPQFHGIHHYYFVLLALDIAPEIKDGLTMWRLLEKVDGHVLGVARLIGTYER